MNYNELMKDVHDNAVAHGWWDKPRSYKGIVALMHSELSEALEEDRAGRPMVWFLRQDPMSTQFGESDLDVCTNMALFKNEKPEGIAVELADCIIRIMDYLGSTEVDLNNLLKETDGSGAPEIMEFADFISDMHLILASTTVINVCKRNVVLAAAIEHIYAWAKLNDVDMDEIVRMKHEYNKTRPYKHGKAY